MYKKTKNLKDPSQIVSLSYNTSNKTKIQSTQYRLKPFEGKTSYVGMKYL